MAWTFVGTASPWESKTAGTSFSGSTIGFPVTAGMTVVSVLVFDNPASTTVPTVTATPLAGASDLTEILAPTGVDISTTAGSGLYIAAYTWTFNQAFSSNSGISVVFSLSASVVGKAIAHYVFTGGTIPLSLRVAPTTGTSVSGAPSATLGSAPTTGDLVMGLVAGETNATPTGDADTTDGSWSAIGVWGTSGGGGATTHLKLGMQYKQVTGTSIQTYNPSTANSSVAVVFALEKGAAQDFAGTVNLAGSGLVEGYRLGFGEVHLGSEGVLGKRRETRSLLPRRLSSYSVGIGSDGAIGAFSNGKITHFNGNNTSGSYLTDAVEYTIGTDTWTNYGNGVQHADGGYVNVGDYCYAVGGRDATSTPTTTFRRFTSGGSVSTMTAMPEAVFINGAVHHDGYIYSFGGNFTNATYDYKGHFRYSISGNSWEELAMPDTGTTLGLTTALGAVFDGLIYWVGDVVYSGTVNYYLYIYDPATDTWVSDGATNTITRPAEAGGQGYTSVQDPESGVWYVIGRTTIWAFTPDAGWVLVGGNGWDLWYFAGAVVSPYDNKIYLVGGRPHNDSNVAGGMPISRLDVPVPTKPAGIITNSPVPATTLQVAWEYDSPDIDPQLQYQFRWTATSGSNYTEKPAVSSGVTCGAMSLTGFTTGTYYVGVRTKNMFGWSAWSADVQFSVNTSLSDTALSAPTNAPTVGNGVDGVAVTMPALANGAAWYHLYRDGDLVVQYLAAAEVYTDTEASKTSTQTYTIRGAKAGSESSDSPASTAIAGFPGAPDFSVRQQNVGALVQISQKPYPAVYKVYRGASGGSRTLVHTSPERPGIGIYTWADAALSDQTAYDYHVTTEVAEPTVRESAASTIATITTSGRAGRWTKTAASVPHHPDVMFEVNGKAYLIGGTKYTGTWVLGGYVTEYDLGTGTMTAKTSLGSYDTGRTLMGAVYNDEIYIMGLDSTNPETALPFAKYTPATDTWTTTLAQPQSPIGNSLAGALDGKLYFLQGQGTESLSSDDGSNRVLIYNVDADEWSTGQPHPGFRFYNRATGQAPVWENTLYLTGGAIEEFVTFNYEPDFNVYAYDALNKEWRTETEIPDTTLQAYRKTVCDSTDTSRFYVLGGYWGTTGYTTKFFEYSFVTKAWRTLPNITEWAVDAGGAAVGYEGKVYYIGNPDATTSYIYVFDPVEGDDLALNGSGTLSIEPFIPQGWVGEVELTGTGTLTLSGTPGVAGTVALSGGHIQSPGLAVATIVGVAGATTLAGAGTLTGVGTVPQAEEGDVVLSGEGTIELVAAVELNPPTDITITIVSPTQLDISWTAAPSATGYDIERDGVIIAEYHQSTSYSDTGLTEGTTYTYRVRSQKVVTE